MCPVRDKFDKRGSIEGKSYLPDPYCHYDIKLIEMTGRRSILTPYVKRKDLNRSYLDT